MTAYDLASIDPEAINTSHGLVLDLITAGSTVLDVGCSTGMLGAALVDRGCTVDGVERDHEAAEAARSRLRTVIEMDLDGGGIGGLAEGAYDFIVFADVLEHLRHPEHVLQDALRLLAPGGQVVVSVPNVAHGSLRLALLQGRWQYRDLGLLDRTHVHFFTRATLVELVEGAGLRVERMRSTVVDPLASEVELDGAELPELLVTWVRCQPESFDYQYVLLAAVGTPDATPPQVEPADTLPELVEARASGASPLQIQALLEDRQSLRRKVLTLRDHAVGAEAELGHARREHARMSRELAEAKHEVAELRSSASWRVGQLAVAPLSKVRRAIRGGA